MRLSFWMPYTLSLLAACTAGAAQESPHRIVLSSGGLVFTAEMDSFRYGFELDGKTVVGMDDRAGVMLAGSPVDVHPEQSCLASH